MNSSIKVKHLVVLVIVAGLGYFLYSKQKEVLGFIKSLNQTGPEKAADFALRYLKTQEGPSTYFSDDFRSSLLSKYSFYKVQEWELSSVEDSNGDILVDVKGEAQNAFGATLERNLILVVRNETGQWKVSDSYGLFLISGFTESDKFTSDLEKDRLIEEVKDLCKIEEWSFRTSYGGAIRGMGTVYNGSAIPVEFVKVRITYFNRSGQIVNTDESYAVSEKLYPKQRRSFEWITSNCNGCNRASVTLIFDE